MSLGVAADERFGKDDEFGSLPGGVGGEVGKSSEATWECRTRPEPLERPPHVPCWERIVGISEALLSISHFPRRNEVRPLSHCD